MRSFNIHETELMDRPQPVNGTLKETLRELEWMNQHLGGHRYLRRFLDSHFKTARNLRILDLATGGGDFPRAMVDWAQRNDINIHVDGVDQNPSIISLAREFSVEFPQIDFIAADALAFDSRQPYDLVHSSLSLHHFSDRQAVAFLKQSAALSCQFVLITDLERTFLTRVGVHLVNTLLNHNQMTVQDGDTSARRAFSFRELRAIAKGAGWQSFGHERFLWGRQALWMRRAT
jgi:2-polyprenyl-3-methyl-5-hydroxy-6-metoxy-1,4-benzoquinol methylase